MTVRLLAASLAGLIVASATAAAQDERGELYLGVRAIGSVAAIDDVEARGVAGAHRVENDDDLVAGVGGVVGYVFRRLPLRAEIEGAHRFRFDLDNRDLDPAGTVDYETNIATTSVLFNAFLELRNRSAFTPYVGGSIGWARHDVETGRGRLGAGKVTEDSEQDNLAWGVMAGVGWAFAERWTADLAYRYLNLGDIETARFAGGGRITSDDYTSHDVLLSLYYRF